MSKLPAVSLADDLLRRFQQAFADSTLTAAEAQDLRQRLAAHGQQGTDPAELRHQVFRLARDRFNTFQDKAVIEWLEAASALLLPSSPPQPAHSEVYFSPGTACVEAIQRFIGQAAHRLDVCVFTISDDRITDALRSAHRRGVALRLLTDNDKLHDCGSDVQQLQAAGITVRIDRTDNHMHHKFAVADNRTILTGSYNWTRSAAAVNQENLLITDDSAIVQRYASEFARLWESMADYEGSNESGIL
ncbi:phospholipase D-like domain-containing protein [Hymenobacter sp. BT491]|uniref:phospholipase D-like domain-containing protein n=1 Tax=Hymenobacter sp. BT491 TaxID=2766779 RepID=UPI001653A7D2|nr:phospholipase D-like domain-containing protein [Hymenobacter sp. BT491]MBC6991255.1 DUF1669 domain-containing protein [Hymenobacter sp. BT491]